MWPSRDFFLRMFLQSLWIHEELIRTLGKPKKRGCRIALSLSYFLLFTAFCLSDGDENIGSGGQTTGPDTFSPPPLSFTFSLSFIQGKKFTVVANKCSIAKLLSKAGNKDTKSSLEIISKMRYYKIACIGIRETMSLRRATVLNNSTLEGFLQIPIPRM